MNEQPATPNTRRRQVQVRLQRLRHGRNGGVLGMTEIIALGGSILVFIVVIMSYLYFLVPARSSLETAKTERSRLQAVLNSSRNMVREGETTEATVKEISESLDTFESARLFKRTEGRMDLYGELNQLMHKNGLRNTSGPSYTTLEPAGSKTNAASSKAASTKWQSTYPGIGISLTVEGPYQNLRRFIRDLEASKLFIIINGVELERAAEASAEAAREGGATSQRASLVSLRLDMATYFQRTVGEAEDAGQAAQH